MALTQLFNISNVTNIEHGFCMTSNLNGSIISAIKDALDLADDSNFNLFDRFQTIIKKDWNPSPNCQYTKIK